eukprot:524797-Amorphochlora_amoeboformis.AAC.1
MSEHVVELGRSFCEAFPQYVKAFQLLDKLRANPNGKTCKVLVCSVKKDSNNPLASPGVTRNDAETLVTAYQMLLQDKTLGGAKQEAMDMQYGINPDWASLRKFVRKRKQMRSSSQIRMRYAIPYSHYIP